MSSLNSRAFFRQWQMLYDASNPDHLKDRWKVDGIDWTKERHAYWGENYSTQYEVHRLVHWEGRELEWQLLVVVERWWGPDRKTCIRNVSWCRAVSGKSDKVRAWFKKRSAGYFLEAELSAQCIEKIPVSFTRRTRVSSRTISQRVTIQSANRRGADAPRSSAAMRRFIGRV